MGRGDDTTTKEKQAYLLGYGCGGKGWGVILVPGFAASLGLTAVQCRLIETYVAGYLDCWGGLAPKYKKKEEEA